MVYVQNRFGKPLMPTKDHRMVRLLLNEGKAKVVRKNPFTIRLKIRTKEYIQPITLGVDAGSKNPISAQKTDQTHFTLKN